MKMKQVIYGQSTKRIYLAQKPLNGIITNEISSLSLFRLNVLRKGIRQKQVIKSCLFDLFDFLHYFWPARYLFLSFRRA